MATALDQRGTSSVSRARLEIVALASVLLAYGMWLYWLTRGTTFSQDEWAWILYRRGNDLATFLSPHNQHLSLVPLVIYRALLATVGARDYGPYRGMVIAGHLVLVALVYAYARRRTGPCAAFAAGALVLCLGAGWDVFLWPFEITWLTSLCCGLAALLRLDRADRRGEVCACALLAISLASSGLGLPILLGLAVELAAGRQWRRMWVVAVPAAVYAVWWLAYQRLGLTSGIGLLPRFIADEVASTLAALVGLAGSTTGPGAGDLLEVGRPLAVLTVLLVAWRLLGWRTVPPRVLGLATILASFWVLTAISRAYIGIFESWASRYLYVGGLFVVLLGVELSRGLAVPRAPLAAFALGLAVVVIAGSIAATRGARALRAEAHVTRAELGAMDIARPIASPDYVSLVPYFPFPIVRAGPYFSAERAYGTPAYTPTQIAASSERARQAADTELVQIHGVRLAAAGAAVCGGGPITTSGYTLVLPRRGILLRASTPATVAIRRFASGWTPIGRLVPGESALVRIGPDMASQPWWLVVPSGSVRWCPAR